MPSTVQPALLVMTAKSSVPAHGGGPAGGSPLRMRDASLRLNDFYEVYERPDARHVQKEASRCMNCGAAFCMPEGGYRANDGSPAGCPISNRIPEWNELAERGRWREAYDRLVLTNNFPEFTARVCPAPCQDACIVGIHDRPVAIKSIERAIIDQAFDHGWVRPNTPKQRSGKRIVIVGSGPAGLAAADELNKLGHEVAVYERSDTPGGLLHYGIPNMKLDKQVVARRVDLLQQSGITFHVSADIGRQYDARQLLAECDAMVLATGALQGRELRIPSRQLPGVVQAIPYLEHATRHVHRHEPLDETLDARGRHVVVIGGGDTGADCIGTALRQGALSVINITRREKPPEHRDADHAWPGPTGAYTLDYSHAEGHARNGQDPRCFEIQPLAFVASPGGSRVAGVTVRRLDLPPPPERPEATPTLRADLVILSIGFTGHDSPLLMQQLGVTDPSSPRLGDKLFIAGDLRRGPSLVVHAIAEGRARAAEVHALLHRSG